MTLAKRIQISSTSNNMMHHHVSESAESLHDQTAYEVATAFGLQDTFASPSEADGALLASCKCTMSVETNSAKSNNALSLQVGLGLGLGINVNSEARVYVFKTHICVEQTVLMLCKKRQAIPLSDVLGVVYSNTHSNNEPLSDDSFKESYNEGISPDSFKKAAKEGASFKKRHSFDAGDDSFSVTKLKSFDLQIMHGRQGASLRLTMESKLSDAIARDIEAARIFASEFSLTSGEDESVDLESYGSGVDVLLTDTDQRANALKLLVANAGAEATNPEEASIAGSGNKTPGVYTEIGVLSYEAWSRLVQGAFCRAYKKGDTIIRRDQSVDGLMMIVQGDAAVHVKGAQGNRALVVARLHPGNLLGEMSFLLESQPSADVIAESAPTIVMRIPADELSQTLREFPLMAGKFFCFLATRQAAKLRRFVQQETTELALPKSAGDAETAEQLVDNPACRLILHKYIQATPAMREVRPIIELMHEINYLQAEHDDSRLGSLVRAIADTYAAPHAANPATFLGQEMRDQMMQDSAGVVDGSRLSVKLESQGNYEAAVLRHAYDDVKAACIDAIQTRCVEQFVHSPHYSYILSLKAKEETFLSVGHFKINRMLGEGAFGQVLGVVKRDCGKKYAMKIIKKQKVADMIGDSWDTVSLNERRLLSKLHHPLLLNLAYAFQNVAFLILVMDLCPGGDLSDFGNGCEEKLTADQIRFVGLEVTCVLSFLHRKLVMFRDLKVQLSSLTRL